MKTPALALLTASLLTAPTTVALRPRPGLTQQDLDDLCWTDLVNNVVACCEANLSCNDSCTWMSTHLTIESQREPVRQRRGLEETTAVQQCTPQEVVYDDTGVAYRPADLTPAKVAELCCASPGGGGGAGGDPHFKVSPV